MKILIIQQRYGIGDMVIFLPYIHAISKKFNSPVSLLAKESSKAMDILRGDKHIDKIITLDEEKDGLSGFFKLSKELKKINFEKVFIFNSSLRYNLIAKLIGIKSIHQYPLFRSKDNIVHSAKIFTEDALKEKVSMEPKIQVDNEQVILAKKKYNITNNEKNICVGLSASGDTKRWSIQKYISVCEKINKKMSCRFFLAGGKNDKIFINQFMNSTLQKNCISFENLTVSEAIPLIKNCDFYFGNDTGWLHLSAGLNIKSLGLFMDSPVLAYGKYSKNISVIVPEGFTEATTTHDTLGKEKISVEMVYNKVIKMLTN
tara:strand:+ start:20 stop:967 length:948 start_codon:yes stop_codon:yes gene_type:complete